MLRRPPISTRTDTLLPPRRSSGLRVSLGYSSKRCDARQFRHRALFRSPALYSSIGEKSPAAGTISFFSPFMSTLSSEACMQAQGTEGGPDSGASGLKEKSEEHTSELQSLMRISYAVFCLKKKIITKQHTTNHTETIQ